MSVTNPSFGFGLYIRENKRRSWIIPQGGGTSPPQRTGAATSITRSPKPLLKSSKDEAIKERGVKSSLEEDGTRGEFGMEEVEQHLLPLEARNPPKTVQPILSYISSSYQNSSIALETNYDTQNGDYLHCSH